MNKLFITLYDFFERRRALLCTVLAVLVAAMGAAALQLRFSENITGFFPDGERKAAAAFSNLKIKDKIAVMINTREGAEGTGATAEGMMACADRLVELLEADTLFHRWAQAEASFGSELVDDMRAFLQGHLPLLLTEADYARMDTLLTRQGIARAMESNYRRLLSPVGGFIDEYIYDDPLGLSFGALGKLQELNIGGNYTLFDDYLFSKDMTTLMVFISPRYESSDTGIGDRLVERIEAVLAGLNAEYAARGISADYFGAPAVAAYNARQIKHDMMLTLNIAILVIVVFITLSFRNKLSVLLALIPVALGGLLALAVMSLVCHTISAIAVGAGTVVMGIALSYSIHILCHANHCHDPRQIIRDLAYPLTIGSITTIGAFAGLLFTDSQLLRDFGLFASLTLVGTTLFSLVLLPHLIRKEDRGGGSAVLEGVERLTGMRPDRNRMLVAAILGAVFSLLLAFAAINLRADQTIGGTALNLMAPALVLFFIRIIANQNTLQMLTGDAASWFMIKKSTLGIDKSTDLGFFGETFINKVYLATYVCILLFIILSILLYKTRFGLRLRACGENPQAADSLGINVYKMRYAGTTISGALAGMGGFVYALTTANCASNGDVAGFGFLALAVMIFGNWKPVNIAVSSLLFGLFKCIAASYASIDINGDGIFKLAEIGISAHFYRMLPYIVTLLVLAFTSKSSRAPKAEGIPYDKGQR